MYHKIEQADLSALEAIAPGRVFAGGQISEDYGHDELGGVAHMPEVLEEYSGTEAEKIMRQHRWDENIGRLHTTEIIQNLENELHEVGVRLTEKQQDMLMQLIVQYHNGSRLWCLRGWKPNELADMHGNSDVPSISFGPGLQQAFADGIMDKGDLVRKIQELGWKVME